MARTKKQEVVVLDDNIVPLPSWIELNDRQELFCRKYVVSGNATTSAIEAGYSAKTAHSLGNENLKKPEIKLFIRHLRQSVAQRLGITHERILLERKRLAFSNLKNFYDADGNLIPIHELPDDVSACLESVEIFEEYAGSGETRKNIGRTVKIKVASKDLHLKALELEVGATTPDNGNVTNVYNTQNNLTINSELPTLDDVLRFVATHREKGIQKTVSEARPLLPA